MTDLRAGLRDEVLTAAARRALAELDPELVAQTVLETAEAPERLARHLAAVARRLLERMSETDASAEEQARAVNWAIELLAAGEAADEDVVALPPDLLIGVREPAEGLGAPYLPARPVIPLSANELLVNGHGQPAIGQQLRSELPSAAEVDLLVSFVIWSGVRTLLDELEQVVRPRRPAAGHHDDVHGRDRGRRRWRSWSASALRCASATMRNARSCTPRLGCCIGRVG